MNDSLNQVTKVIDEIIGVLRGILLMMSLFVVCSTFVTVYAISSFVFLRKPQWIHRKRRPAFIVRNIAHRGG
jgi:hypothetical protein